MSADHFNKLSTQYQEALQAFATHELSVAEFVAKISALNKEAADHGLPLYMDIESEEQALEVAERLVSSPVNDYVEEPEPEISDDAEISDDTESLEDFDM